MAFDVFKIRRRWFANDFPVYHSSHNYFRCVVPSCPFSLLMTPVVVNGRRTFQVERVVFPQHCHEFPENNKAETKAIVEAEIDRIKCGFDCDGALKKKHDQWQQQATKEGKKMKEELIKQEAAIEVACALPKATGREVALASKHAMTPRAVNVARKRKMEKRDDYSLEKSSHRKNITSKMTGKILIFGDDMAVQRLAATKVIHADGTFKCILPGFSQLYIFHATVENNLSLPVLFCLVKGKNEQTYIRLLEMV